MLIDLENVTFLEPGTFLPGSNSDMKTFYRPDAGRNAGLSLTYDTDTQLLTMSLGPARRLIHGSRCRDMVPAALPPGRPAIKSK